MPRDFHLDTDVYFEQQRENARTSILSLIDRHAQVGPGTRVLEIGCGAGGVLRAFTERGASVTGVDLHEPSVDYARRRFTAELPDGGWRFETQDIYDVDPSALDGPFDVVVLKDTIEHIHDQRRFFERLSAFMAPDAIVFFAFPPWRMPFGGHQQICTHPLLMRLPYMHLLPRAAYASLLRRGGESPDTVDALLEIKDTGISIARFEATAAETGYRIAERRLYSVNPMYRYRYGLAPRRQSPLIAAAPGVRDFLTTSAYYVLGRASSPDR